MKRIPLPIVFGKATQFEVPLGARRSRTPNLDLAATVVSHRPLPKRTASRALLFVMENESMASRKPN